MFHRDIFRKCRSINFLGSSSIWTCRILNFELEYLLFASGRCSGKNQNKYSKFDTSKSISYQGQKTGILLQKLFRPIVVQTVISQTKQLGTQLLIQLTYHILLVTKSRLTAFLVERNLFLVILCIGLALLVLCHDNHKIMLFVEPCPF